MCYPVKNFELETKFKSKNNFNKRIPKRVQLSFVEDNTCSFEDMNKSSCIKGDSTAKNND